MASSAWCLCGGVGQNSQWIPSILKINTTKKIGSVSEPSISGTHVLPACLKTYRAW